MSTHLHLDHWLGTVYVLPEYRRRGLGSEIVAAAVHLARTLEIKTLYLFTPDQERMYRRLGWIPIEFTRYDERNVVIMKRDLHTLQSGI
jgi:N-acetylglutamate synthase-like GNAT family acetyltransferase